MALTKQTLIFLSIFTLYFFALYSDAASSPSPSQSPSPSPSLSLAPTPTTILTTAPSAEPEADTPVSLSELLELALPEIGVQKKAVSSESEGCKVASTQLQAIERKINEFKSVLQKRLADPKTTQPAQKCITQCQENLADAIDGVKTSIDSIGKHDLAKANIDVSAVATDVDTCNDCFVDMAGIDPEIKAFNEWVRGVTGDCLVNLKKG